MQCHIIVLIIPNGTQNVTKSSSYLFQDLFQQISGLFLFLEVLAKQDWRQNPSRGTRKPGCATEKGGGTVMAFFVFEQ